MECWVSDDAAELAGVKGAKVFNGVRVDAREEAIKDLARVSILVESELSDRPIIGTIGHWVTFCGVSIGVNVVKMPERTPLSSNAIAFGSSSPLYSLNVSSCDGREETLALTLSRRRH